MNKENEKVSNKVILIILTIIAIAIIAYTYNKMDAITDMLNERKEARGELDNITVVMEEIQSIYDKYYIGEGVNKEELEDNALLGFTLGHGDRYGYYTSPEQTKEATDTRLEKLVGIGVEVVYEEDKGYYVAKLYEQSPAIEAGIQVGDYITEVNGIAITNDNKNEILNEVKGEVDTYTNIGITAGSETSQKEIERRDIRANSVQSEYIDNIAYIQIDRFTDYTDEEFIKEVNKYKSEGCNKFIFDLRNNTGGSAESVINMLDYMLPEGLLAYFKNKNIEDDMKYYSDRSEVNGEFIVLVNQATASASELFSKALQEYNKATIVGTTTFGKGTVLSTYTLSNGGALTLSTARYYTKSGDELEGIGVKPDIEVSLSKEKEMKLYKLSKEEDDQLQKALEILRNKN